MGKVQWGVTGAEVDEIEADEGFTPYDGPLPVNVVVRCAVKHLEFTTFSTGSKGLKALLVVDDPTKKQFKGAPLWDNIVDVETAGFKIRQFLDAIGGSGKDWDNTVINSDNMVTKIGRIKTEGLYVRVATKRGRNQDGDARAEVARWISKSADVNEDADDDDGEPAPF